MMNGAETPADRIVRIGEALWGERWQAEMARALGVAKTTVQDWRQGRNAPRPGVWADLAAIVDDRRIVLAGVADDLAYLAATSGRRGP